MEYKITAAGEVTTTEEFRKIIIEEFFNRDNDKLSLEEFRAHVQRQYEHYFFEKAIEEAQKVIDPGFK